MNTEHRWQVFLILETIDHHCDISNVSAVVNIFPHSPLESVFGVQCELVKAEQNLDCQGPTEGLNRTLNWDTWTELLIWAIAAVSTVQY